MFDLLAQLPAPNPPSAVPMSGEWSSPESWSHLFQAAGVPAAVLLFMLMLGGVFGGLFLWWTVGPAGFLRELGNRLWTRLDKFLENVEANQQTTAATLQTHLASCNAIHAAGGPCNVTDLRNAGHEFAEIAREIGKKVGADVDARADNIHKTLRTT